MARNSLLCADVPLRNYSLTHSMQSKKSADNTLVSLIYSKRITTNLYVSNDFTILAMATRLPLVQILKAVQ